MTYKQICTSIFLNNDVSCFTCTDVSIQIANRLSTFKLRIKRLKRQFGFGFFGSVLVKSRSYLPSIISNLYYFYIFKIYKSDRTFKSYKQLNYCVQFNTIKSVD